MIASAGTHGGAGTVISNRCSVDGYELVAAGDGNQGQGMMS